ncbi:hypothetical protein AB4Z38_06970 [Arthrobacter sp. 2RAF6]|uniref:hypothetical protein n=1 Tax=Arthrobacter sp. 2RAF6 TaxID=3233002 RepID=UPI003F933772
MSERDELVDLIEDAVDDAIYNEADAPPSLTGVVASKAADAVLTAGWVKPRTVSTVEELDALPTWSVVRSEQATIWEKFNDHWAETLTTGRHPSDHLALPATVLFEGEA